jgi:hypothetical protein
MTLFNRLILFVFALTLSFCGSKEEPAVSPSNPGSGSSGFSINLSVRDSYVYTNPQTGQQSLRDSILAGASVKVFRSQTNMDNNTNAVLTGTTNSKGEISLKVGNSTGDYFVKAWHPKISQSAWQFVNFSSASQPGTLMLIKI